MSYIQVCTYVLWNNTQDFMKGSCEIPSGYCRTQLKIQNDISTMYHKEKIAIVCAHNFKSMQALSNFSIVRANMFFQIYH